MQVVSVNNDYSSALRRLGAWFIDAIIVGSALSIIFIWSNHGPGMFYSIGNILDDGHHVNSFVKFIVALLYFAYMESSKHQATLGKIAMGIKVVDHNNQRLEFSKALLRNLSKLLSAFILCIGYIMIIFDERKQGLHDKIADTFVVKN